MPGDFLPGRTLDGEAVAVVLDLDATRDKAISALSEFSQVAWGWGSREYDDICEAVDTVLDAITFGGNASTHPSSTKDGPA